MKIYKQGIHVGILEYDKCKCGSTTFSKIENTNDELVRCECGEVYYRSRDIAQKYLDKARRIY